MAADWMCSVRDVFEWGIRGLNYLSSLPTYSVLMRLLIDTPEDHVLVHAPWIEIAVSVIILGVCFLYVLVHASRGDFSEGFFVAGMYFIGALIFVLKYLRFVVVAFDRKLDRIMVSRQLLWLRREESFLLRDLYSVRVERNLIVLQFNRNLPKHDPVCWLDAYIERMMNYWRLPRQRNEIAIVPYYISFYDAEYYASGIRSWAGVGRL